MGKIRIRTSNPWISYAGSTLQNNYAETIDKHGFLVWDISENYVDNRLVEVSNPGPFVTLDYDGDVAATLRHAKSLITSPSRVRVRSSVHLSHRDAQVMMTALRTQHDVIEVVFKVDAQTNSSVVFSDGKSEVDRADLRDPDVLLRLIKGYYGGSVALTTVEWDDVHRMVKGYVNDATEGDIVARNVKWSVKTFEFDNMFGYGEKNFIDFRKLVGVVGIFGPNRVGKSSVVGTLAYLLFNTSDRGTVKNINIINERKEYCSAKATLTIDGVDYLVERQTIKHESKKGLVHAPTHLNFFEVNAAGEIIQDLVGEQRNDTDKIIKQKIGTAEDFFMTSVSSQGDINQFIQHGSTKRRATLSKFLDIDIFDKMHEYAKKDLTLLIGQLRNLAVVTDEDIDVLVSRIAERSVAFDDVKRSIVELASDMDGVKSEASKHSMPVVTDGQVNQQKQKVSTLQQNIDAAARMVKAGNEDIGAFSDKLRKIAEVKSQYDITTLRAMVTELQVSESDIRTVKQELDNEKLTLKQQRKSLNILNEVPCGDEYPTCKFIADAHTNKGLLEGQIYRVEEFLAKLEKMERNVDSLRRADYHAQLEKVEKLHELESRLRLDIIKKEADVARSEVLLEKLRFDHDKATLKLKELELAFSGEENELVKGFREKITALQGKIDVLDTQKMKIASEIGRIEGNLEQKRADVLTREDLLKEMRLYEVVTGAFSKKGLPNLIVNSQLPVINEKIANILHGIVDFDIELEVDESDFLEVYINYGDSRRPIELCSGMEKMIASLAIRVALVEVSTLPKSDMLIIDEGFGTLDEAGIEACNRMLLLLKDHFRIVLIISHMDGVKDIADIILEIVRNEKNSQIVYTGE